MPNYINEIKCTCGGFVGELFGIDYDGDEDEIIRTVRGVCSRCEKKYVYKERYSLLGFYDIKESK